MRYIAPALLACVTLVTSGCVMVDCSFSYHVRGRLVDSATGSPVTGAKLAVEDRGFAVEQESPDWPGFTRTGSDGTFADEFGTGLSWGYTICLGFVVRGSRTGPLPPKLDSVFVAVQNPETGGWLKQTIPVPPAEQDSAAPAERWLDLGTVLLPFAR